MTPPFPVLVTFREKCLTEIPVAGVTRAVLGLVAPGGIDRAADRLQRWWVVLHLAGDIHPRLRGPVG